MLGLQECHTLGAGILLAVEVFELEQSFLEDGLSCSLICDHSLKLCIGLFAALTRLLHLEGGGFDLLLRRGDFLPELLNASLKQAHLCFKVGLCHGLLLRSRFRLVQLSMAILLELYFLRLLLLQLRCHLVHHCLHLLEGVDLHRQGQGRKLCVVCREGLIHFDQGSFIGLATLLSGCQQRRSALMPFGQQILVVVVVIVGTGSEQRSHRCSSTSTPRGGGICRFAKLHKGDALREELSAFVLGQDANRFRNGLGLGCTGLASFLPLRVEVVASDLQVLQHRHVSAPLASCLRQILLCVGQSLRVVCTLDLRLVQLLLARCYLRSLGLLQSLEVPLVHLLLGAACGELLLEVLQHLREDPVDSPGGRSVAGGVRDHLEEGSGVPEAFVRSAGDELRGELWGHGRDHLVAPAAVHSCQELRHTLRGSC
mmetsp:Transcript_43936/g.94085  ORF Transcript_43936/g.94085 Transcript_43936/m.94085 type:complete len:427 (-) Transcript_43936:914-2194(-)